MTKIPSPRSLRLLNPRVLAITARLIVWDLPAAVRPLKIVLPGGDPSSFLVPWPRLLLSAVVCQNGQKQLHAVAIRRKARPREDSPLFHAPLMNTDSEGRIQLASDTDLPEVEPCQIEIWDDVLLGYQFSVVGHERTVRPDGMVATAAVNSYHHARCWRQIARSELDRFPGQALVPRRQTVAGWLEQLESLTIG